jgi:hypothetical protein
LLSDPRCTVFVVASFASCEAAILYLSDLSEFWGALQSFKNKDKEKPYTLNELERLPHKWKQYMTEKALENLVRGGEVANDLSDRLDEAKGENPA